MRKLKIQLNYLELSENVRRNNFKLLVSKLNEAIEHKSGSNYIIKAMTYVLCSKTCIYIQNIYLINVGWLKTDIIKKIAYIKIE
jgi:hypothetical protein